MADFVGPDAIEALRQCGTEPLPHFEESLLDACELYPPPFGQRWYGEKYRLLASNPSWFATSLIANAEKEGEGARKLWSIAARAPDADIGQKIRQHAIDESRHALMYVAICDLVFPDAITTELREFTDDLSPRYSPKDLLEETHKDPPEKILDELIQMNIGEIRTRIHQLLMRPLLAAYCPEQSEHQVKSILESLLGDETKHIQYTARLIDKLADEGFGSFVKTTTKERLRDFNLITLEEVGEDTFAAT